MTWNSNRLRGAALSALVGLALLATASGCTNGGVTQDRHTIATCAAPLQGRRFSLCGSLTTGTSAGQSANGLEVKASVDSTASYGSRHYQILGGSFHASH